MPRSLAAFHVASGKACEHTPHCQAWRREWQRKISQDEPIRFGELADNIARSSTEAAPQAATEVPQQEELGNAAAGSSSASASATPSVENSPAPTDPQFSIILKVTKNRPEKCQKPLFLSFVRLFLAYFGVCSVFLSCRGSRCSQA